MMFAPQGIHTGGSIGLDACVRDSAVLVMVVGEWSRRPARNCSKVENVTQIPVVKGD